jgi:hypothetical protein
VSEDVLLFDLDTKPGFSNLALMQASSFHRRRGDRPRLYKHSLSHRRLRSTIGVDVDRHPDRIYLSCIFSWNAPVADRYRRLWDTAKVHIGGTGWDIWRAGSPSDMTKVVWSALPDPIPHFGPDYDLYGYDYAIGFCNRGCDRACRFCVVHYKEGGIKIASYRHPSSWVPDGFRKAMLLDNDIALYPAEQQREILNWFVEAGVKPSITQGWDLRCIAQHPEQAQLLAEVRPWADDFSQRMVYTAWDYLGNEAPVRRGLHALRDAGIPGRSITVYLLCGFVDGVTGYRDTHEDDLHRMRVVWEEFGCYPYVMPYNNRRDDPWLNRFARFVNRKIFKMCRWEDYDPAAYHRKARRDARLASTVQIGSTAPAV